jgi:KH-domain-like of EngA bacterial GTPase enzymes, C-terminal
MRTACTLTPVRRNDRETYLTRGLAPSPDALPASYERFLANGLRNAFDLPGVPIRISKRTSDNFYAGKRSRQR